MMDEVSINISFSFPVGQVSATAWAGKDIIAVGGSDPHCIRLVNLDNTVREPTVLEKLPGNIERERERPGVWKKNSFFQRANFFVPEIELGSGKFCE